MFGERLVGWTEVVSCELSTARPGERSLEEQSICARHLGLERRSCAGRFCSLESRFGSLK